MQQGVILEVQSGPSFVSMPHSFKGFDKNLIEVFRNYIHFMISKVLETSGHLNTEEHFTDQMRLFPCYLKTGQKKQIKGLKVISSVELTFVW